MISHAEKKWQHLVPGDCGTACSLAQCCGKKRLPNCVETEDSQLKIELQSEPSVHALSSVC